MDHVIRHQYLDVEFAGGEVEALALQKRFSEWCQDDLTPTLGKLFDRLVPQDEVWLLERLEIDVGELAIGQWEQELPKLLCQAIEQKLRNMRTISKYDVKPISFDSAGFIYKPSQSRLLEVLAYFLKTGSLPWSGRLPAGQSLEQALLANWQDIPVSRGGELLAVLASAVVRKRLLQQFSEAFSTLLLANMEPELANTMATVCQRLTTLNLPADELNVFKERLWQTVWTFAAARQRCSELALVRAAWLNFPLESDQTDNFVGQLEQFWPGVIGDKPRFSDQQMASKNSVIDNQERVSQNKNKRRSESGTSAEADVVPEKTPELRDFAEQSELAWGKQDGQVGQHPDVETGIYIEQPELGWGKQDWQVSQHPDVETGIYIDNAGLVLLHPFLPQFFHALGIAVEDQLVQPERAVVLLHFLTTGQVIAPEYELVLPKLLCAIPLLTPVAANVALVLAELEEAEALLEAVIRHWEILQNTSIDGLRGTFLVRAGKLSLREDGDWLLQVEQQSFDILLGQLPWGFGAIKLPWMQDMLWVEWAS